MRLALVYAAGLLAALGYGFTLVLPLYVAGLHGNEADAGRVLSAGARTLLCVPFAGTIADRISADRLAALAALVFGAGILGLALNDRLGPFLFGCGFLLGCGWGCSSPRRRWSWRATPTTRGAARCSACSRPFRWSASAAGPCWRARCCMPACRSTRCSWPARWPTPSRPRCSPAVRSPDRARSYRTAPEYAPPRLRDVAAVLRGPAAYPIAMVFLGACVFSALFNFQAGFAAARGLDYTVFYVTYSVVVIGLRFLAAGFVGRLSRDGATIGLLTMMTAAVALLLVTGANPVYALAAALLGAGYGLVYP